MGERATCSWLATVALAGSTAVAPRWQANPAPAVRALGGGLRRLHGRLAIEA